jgi:hypothetical protein
VFAGVTERFEVAGTNNTTIVGAGSISASPEAAVLRIYLEAYDAAEICSSWISRCLNNDSRWICQDDDGTRLSKEESRLL